MTATHQPRGRGGAAEVQIICGSALDVLPTLDAGSVQMCLTSPPFFALRSYLPADHPDKHREIGSEPTPEAFVATMVEVFRNVRRVLRDDGTLVLNLGDSMSGSGKGPTGHNGIGSQGTRQGFTGVSKKTTLAGATKGSQLWQPILGSAGKVDGLPPKNLLMIPFRVAMALQADGWILRSVIPWVKRNPMPESVTDRPASAIEYLFLFAKSARYHWDAEAIRQEATGAGGPRFGVGRKEGPSFSAVPHLYETGVGGRSYRNSDAFFQTWQGLMLDDDGDPLALVVNPKPNPLPHFASFPDTLVTPFVKAGTSEKGACPACGSPWIRVVERTATAKDRTTGKGWQAGIAEQENWASGTPTHSGLSNGTYQRGHTLGWQPGCTCDAGPPIPQTVLDPFGGSGTVGVVASRLGRAAVLIELNSQYCEMARKRIANDAPLLTADTVTVSSPEQMGMFDPAAAPVRREAVG